jgi:septal ring factor EnvC (AmiA/AmiB activator)
MSDDPASVADAIEALGAPAFYGKPPANHALFTTAARLLRDHAATTNRLTMTESELTRFKALNEQSHQRNMEVLAEFYEWQKQTAAVTAERDDLAARLSALTAKTDVDAPVHYSHDQVLAWAWASGWNDAALAAAVQPPEEGTTDG